MSSEPRISTDTNSTASAGYQSLLTEIQNTIDRNDRLFQQIQQSNYPNAGNYQSDLLNYKIDAQVSDLTKARQTVWDFLNKKYQENTNLRNYYFNEIRKADEHIGQLNKQQQNLIDSIQKKELLSTTTNESIKFQKYQMNKKNYYLFLYKVLLVIQTIILICLALCLTGMIPRSTCLIVIVIILIATVAFVGYYVFYVNIGRSAFSWTKFEHDNGIQAKGGQCVDDSGVSDSDKQKVAADLAIKDLIQQNQNPNCSLPTNSTQ
jgi:lipopolysaccharide export LptBFGC system permease protein LptF